MQTRASMAILAIAWIVAFTDGGCSSSNEPGTGGLTGGAASAGDTHVKATTALDVVFNEIAAVGRSEWIEIVNRGPGVVDVSNYLIADTSKKKNEPKLDSAMRFPAGTTLEPGQRVLILTSQKSGVVGPHPKSECLVDGPETCFFATFGVSATSGESLHLLAPDGSIITSTAMPRSASADAGGATNTTQCRLPDLTGDFTTCAPSPGQPNRAP